MTDATRELVTDFMRWIQTRAMAEERAAFALTLTPREILDAISEPIASAADLNPRYFQFSAAAKEMRDALDSGQTKEFDELIGGLLGAY